MTKNFTGKIGSETFTDAALFEVAATEFRAAKKSAAKRGEKSDWNAPQGGNADLVRRARGTWKAPKAKAFEERVDFEVGAEIVVLLTEFADSLDGEPVDGQVWSEAPEGGVWVATECGFFWVSKRDGHAERGLPSYGGTVGRAA